MEATAALQLKAEPLTREGFAPFGDVIESEGAKHFAINAGTIERFHDLAQVDLGEEEGGRTLVSIAEVSVHSPPFRTRSDCGRRDGGSLVTLAAFSDHCSQIGPW